MISKLVQIKIIFQTFVKCNLGGVTQIFLVVFLGIVSQRHCFKKWVRPIQFICKYCFTVIIKLTNSHFIFGNSASFIRTNYLGRTKRFYTRQSFNNCAFSRHIAHPNRHNNRNNCRKPFRYRRHRERYSQHQRIHQRLSAHQLHH